ncbi:MAG: DUF1549 domain-containing protein [Planctomycetes bacterium]|nr:DUF1549 domain-containing protein [Planctomycetota bacterium]
MLGLACFLTSPIKFALNRNSKLTEQTHRGTGVLPVIHRRDACATMIVGFIVAMSLLGPRVAAAAPVSFDVDVMAVLSKAGCNAGVCHGNQNGKGGFKLSLRGDHPQRDYRALTRDQMGRRINRVDPAGSLILLKPGGRLAHEGGKRFDRDSTEYKILRAWIADGTPRRLDGPKLTALRVTPASKIVFAPVDSVQLKVEATFSDGSRRDVTSLAVYEPSNLLATVTAGGRARRVGFGETTILVRYLHKHLPVTLAFMPERKGFAWTGAKPSNYIDRHVLAKLRKLRMNPSELCDDSTFVRRAFLDAIGLPPTADEARAFVADKNADKRKQLIDRLLAREEFNDWWALKWADLLRVEEKLLDAKGVKVFHGWIRQSFAENKPLDRFVREILTAHGSTYANPPTNFYRALRNPIARAETTAQLFLGVRVQCAKCHNHPFGRWTQDDYYGWASFFVRVDYKIIKNDRRDKFDKQEFKGEQIVLMKDSGEMKNPTTGKQAVPRLLGEAPAKLSSDQQRLVMMADWLTAAENEQFARAQVNRIWYHLMGAGIVTPIDDFRATNPPINGPLLDALANDFVEHKFDLRHLIRTIMNSRTYQLSAEPNATNRDDAVNFSHALVRRLSAEQLHDAIHLAAGVKSRFNGYDEGTRAVQLAGVKSYRRRDKRPTAGEMFLKTFGKPGRLLSCECERSNDTTLKQAFVLISGQMVNDVLQRDGGRVDVLAKSKKTNRQIVEELTWTTLSRPPSDAEITGLVAHLNQAKDRKSGVEDVAWALINAKEFLLRK